MKAKTYYQWVGKRVRHRGATDGRVGQIVDSAGIHTWWLVEWEDGKKTKMPQRLLEVLPEDDRSRGEPGTAADRPRD